MKKIEVEKLSETHPRVRLKIDPTTERDLRIKACNLPGVLSDILHRNGVQFEGNSEGTFAANYPCPKCGVSTFTISGRPAMRLVPGHYRSSGGNQPTTLRCTACGAVEDGPAAFVRFHGKSVHELDLYPTNLAEIYRDVVALDGHRQITDYFTRAARSMAPASFDPLQDIRGLRCYAYNEDIILDALQQGLLDEHMQVVPCTNQCEPLNPAWHGERLTGAQAYDQRMRGTVRSAEFS